MTDRWQPIATAPKAKGDGSVLVWCPERQNRKQVSRNFIRLATETRGRNRCASCAGRGSLATADITGRDPADVFWIFRFCGWKHIFHSWWCLNCHKQSDE